MFEPMELHTHLKVVKRGKKGRSCCGSAAYRAGENIRDTEGDLHRFSKKGGVVDSWIMLPSEAPKEFADRETLWRAADMAEHKKDGTWRKNPQLYRDWNANMPNEFSYERAHCLLEELLQPLVDAGMIADVSIHDPEPDPGKERNLHAHIMITMRVVSEDGFGKKGRNWNDINLAEDLRRNWAELCNEELVRMGHEPRVEWQTYADRGIAKLAQRHEGPGQRAWAKKQGVEAEYINKNMRYNHSKMRIAQVKKEGWPLMQAALDVLDAPYHRLSIKEEKARKITHNDGIIFFAAPKKDLERLIGERAEQEIWDAAIERHKEVRQRQRDIWKLYDEEKALVSALNENSDEKKKAAEAAWTEFRIAKSVKDAAWADYKSTKSRFWSYDGVMDEGTILRAQAQIESERVSAAYNRARALGNEASRGVKAERIAKNYRNFALGLARDIGVPKAELDEATEAYKKCLEELQKSNTSKVRHHLSRQLEAMREEAEKKARHRRRKQLVETLKRILFKKEQEEKHTAGRKVSLDDQMKGAADRRSAQAQTAQQQTKGKEVER